jgi:hypothetical protein
VLQFETTQTFILPWGNGGLSGRVDLAYCPRCGKWLSIPVKKLENRAFSIALYNCNGCGLKFKTM